MSQSTPFRDISRSLFGLGVTLPLYGAQQALRVASLRGVDEAARSIDAVARAARGQLDGPWSEVVKLARCFQESFVQFAPPLARSALRDPGMLPDAAVGIARRTLDALQLVPEQLVGVAASELRSKFQVFCLVADVADILGVPEEPPFPLHELVERAYQLDPFETLWAVEGIGHLYAESALEQEAQPRGILGPQVSSTLPEKSLLMLHAGIGLGFAQQRLDEAIVSGGARSAEALAPTMADVVELCVTNSLPGYVGPAFESIGLVARSFFPDLVDAVSAALRAVAREALPFYWHGVGRAVYFLPINFFPGSGEQVFATVEREAPDEELRLSAVAGASWAVTLVAQRDPRIMAELYLGTLGEAVARDGGFANGVASSNIMRTDTTPGSDLVANFLAYRPPPSAGAQVARLWEEEVLRPSQIGLREVYPVLRQEQRLGEIFRYHDDLLALARTTSKRAPALAATVGASAP